MEAKFIKRIVVKKLFGMYDYELKAPTEAVNPDRLLIMYGDNGSGKTTILKALFYLLSPDTGKGHKTALVRIPLSYIEVEFTTGDKVWLQRNEGQLTGSFKLGLLLNKKENNADFTASEDNLIKASEQTNSFLKLLSNLNLAFYFLSDDRAVQLAGTAQPEVYLSSNVIVEKMNELGGVDLMMMEGISGKRSVGVHEQRAQQLLLQSMERAEQWIKSQAVRGSSQGESSVNALYAEIISRISKAPPSTATNAQSIENLISKIENRSKTYAIYGLLPEFNGKEILKVVKSVGPDKSSLVSSVLTPYLDSVEKKLDAMESLQKQIDALVVLVNKFYTRKRLSYDIHKGFSIMTDDGKSIQPQFLSSGERHLLLLFCSTIQALDKQSIFMIDEPEISLNIKWQRLLLSALLECAGQNPVQYLIATHSFEILSKCGGNVIKLNADAE